MTRAKHTPGEWKYKGITHVPGSGHSWEVKIANGSRSISCEGRTSCEADANARLVAYSPVLRDMLCRVVACWRDNQAIGMDSIVEHAMSILDQVDGD